VKNDLQAHFKALIPKRPTYVFWQHRNFGQVHVIGDLHILS